MKSKTKGMMSFGDIRELVSNAICAREGADYSCYIVDIFTDTVVFESCGKDGVCKYYQCSYTVADGQATLGESVEVEKQVEYVPLKAAGQIVAAKAGETSGFKWEVRVCAFGLDLNGNYWDKDVLTAAVDKFEGAKVFMLSEAQHQDKPHKFGKPTMELQGVLQGAVAKADGIYATLILLPTATWLRENLVGCADLGLKNVLGLSVDVRGRIGTKMVGGKKYQAMTMIASATVDVVYDPVARGEFLKMAAARQQGQEEDQMLKKLLAALETVQPDLHKEITTAMQAGSMTDDQAIQRIAGATVQQAGGNDKDEKLVAAAVASLTAAMTATTENAALKEMRIIACGTKLDSMLAASQLPAVAQDDLRTRFTGKVFDETELQAAIKGMKELTDKLTASGTVTGLGQIRMGYDSCDKLQAAFDGMLGVKLDGDLAQIRPFSGIRAAYVEMTGDHDVSGVLSTDAYRRLQAAYSGTTFETALGNAMYRRIVQDYREMSDYGVSRIVGGNIRNAKDFRSLQAFIIGYYSDLPTVDTDIDDYPDLGEVGEDMIEYALMEQGGIISVKRKTIINDDLRLIDKIVGRLGRGARRGVARKAWTPLISNATYKGDNKAIFHADHGNLGSAAYSIAAAEAARTAMFNQTEPDSGDKLGLVPVCVCFPPELRALVSNVNNFNPQAVAVESGNSMYQYFKAEGLFQNPFMTDANDWIMCGDPNECEIVELAFLNGQQEPQLFIANNPSAGGQMFLNGSIQYRISHDYNAEVIDTRNIYKGVVAP